MRLKHLLTKTLLVAAGLCMGGSAWGVTETYPFNVWVTSNVYFSAGTQQNFTVSVPVDNVATELNMYLIPNTTLGGELRDFKGRFAVSDVKGSGSSTKGWWFQTGKIRTNASNSGGTSNRQWGPFAMSILNLYAGDEVTITGCSEKNTKYLTFRSANAKNKSTDKAIESGITTHPYNGTVTYVMTADGHLDFSGPDAVMISSIVIETTHGVESIDEKPTIEVTGAYEGNRTITITSPETNTGNSTVTYYTLDGSTPTTSSNLYSTPFTISVTDDTDSDGEVTVKAVSYKEDDISMSSSEKTITVSVGETLTLNAPSIILNTTANFTQSGKLYYPQYTFTSNQSNIYNPAVNYTYTIAGSANAVNNPTGFSETKAGQLIVTAHADGYNSASTTISVTPYVLSKAYDFSDSNYPLNSTSWTSSEDNKTMPQGGYSVSGTRYQTTLDPTISGNLFEDIAFGGSDNSLYYYVTGLGLGYVGKSGANTTAITISGLTANDYTVYVKYHEDNRTSYAVSSGTNSWSLGKIHNADNTSGHCLHGIFVYSPASSEQSGIIGAVDYTTGYMAAATESHALAQGKKVTYTFKNHGKNAANYNNWALEMSGTYNEKSFVYGWCGGSHVNNDGKNTFTTSVTTDGTYMDWTTHNKEMMDGDVTLTAYYYNNGIFTVKSTDIGAEHTYNTWFAFNNEQSGNIALRLGVDGSWLEITDITTGEDATVDVTVGNSGWATLYTPTAVDFSTSGLKAYTATVEENIVTLTEVTNVPANTGVVLKGTPGTYNLPEINSSTTNQGSLQGSIAGATFFDENTDRYMLAINENKNAQFTKLGSGFITAGKAYLPVTNTNNARALTVVFADESTGISEVGAGQQKAGEAIYNLRGQRVEKAVKGLYIQNGKKMLMK